MRYLALGIRIALMLIGLVIIFQTATPFHPNPDCLSGIAIFLIGLYLGLQGKYGNNFTKCIFYKEVPKKKGFFK